MKNKIINVLLATLFVSCSPIWGCDYVNAENNIQEISTVIYEDMNMPDIDDVLCEIISKKYIQMMDELETTKDKKQWYLDYRNFVSTYCDYIGAPETITNYYSSDDYMFMCKVVEAEVGNYGFDEKCNVASVIFNRIDNENFGNSIREVLIPSQFSTISSGVYKKKKISQDTLLACAFAFEIKDTAQGCLYFESLSSDVHYRYADFVFNDSAHKFFK